MDTDSTMSASSNDEVERYHRTGEHDALFSAWPGENIRARARQGDSALRQAVISVVKSRTRHATAPDQLADLDVVAFTCKKVEPMIRALFPAAEQEPVLDVLSQSVVFLSPTNIELLLNTTQYLSTAWKLANIYLASCDSKLLADDAPQLVGLSEATTCFVSVTYFRSKGQFDDFLVHEAAHIFHNCKRCSIGLPEVRGREWLLAINFGKRETFAYACEAYSRILELGNSAAARRELLLQVENGPMPPDERVDAGEYIDVLRAAVAARNGWKHILGACAPPRKRQATSRDRRT
jgi:hypothetical protein